MPTKGCKNGLGLRPKNPTHRNARPERQRRGSPQGRKRPCGERRAHRSGEGCPECNGGSARLKRRLRPTQRRLNGAYKVPQAHLPPPNLPRFGGGERPPFCCKPPAPLTITMGQRPCTLQAANQKVFTFLPHSPPPLRRGQGWWFAVLRSSAAAIKMRRRLFLSPSACSTDLFLGSSLKINSYPAQQGDRVFRAQP